MEKKTLSRRDFLRLTSTAAVGAVIASCSPKQAATDAATGPKSLTKDEITLRMWHWDNFLAEGYKPVSEKFTAAHSNIKVAIEMTDYNEYSQKVAASIAGGTVPDVTGTVAEHFTNMAGQGQLVDLKPYVDGTKFDLNDYHPGNLSQNSWGGKLLSIPYTADGMWWFYQVDKFTEKGVKTPYEYWKEGNWTWETAAALAEQFSSGEGTDKVFGWGGLGTGNYFEMFPYMASNGSGLFDEKYTACQLTDAKVSDLYQWGFDLRKFAPGPEDQQSGTPASGKVIQWLDWSPYGQVYATQMPFKYSYAPPPASPKTKKHVFCGDAPGFGILKGAKHPDESWAYIQWINTPESMETVFQFTGQEPPRMSVATDPKLWERNTKFPDSKIGYEMTVTRFKEGFYNTPKVSNFVEMWNAHNEEISLAWTDKQPLADALSKANSRIDDLLKEAKVDQDKLYWTGA
jgi:multiple sugar transport system substrate-binding protein